MHIKSLEAKQSKAKGSVIASSVIVYHPTKDLLKRYLLWILMVRVVVIVGNDLA